MKPFDFDHHRLDGLDRRRLHEWQDERLGSLIAKLATNEFYLEKFRSTGMEMSAVRGAEDLRRLSFTTKSELVAEQQAHPPYGRLLTYPRRRRPF